MLRIGKVGFVWIGLLAIAVGPAAAETPLPAGYERMMSPQTSYDAKLHYSTKWTHSYSGVSYNYGFSKGTRVVDLEIESYNKAPNTNKQEPYQGDHLISVVEVPNKGLLGCENWLMAYGQNLDGMTAVLNPGFDPNTGAVLPHFRPTDIELYYRKSPFSGQWEATYAFVAVENAGKHYADWDFVPPMPWTILFFVLENMQNSGWRPYDVEFAKDNKGEIWGTALLTNDEGSGGLPVPWMQQWFTPWQLATLREQGWQLLDMELNPLIFPGNFPAKSTWPAYYGIFVHTSLVSEESTTASLTNPLNEDWITAAEIFGAGTTRIIDIEYAGQGEPELANTGKQFEPYEPPWAFEQASVNPIYAAVWLGKY